MGSALAAAVSLGLAPELRTVTVGGVLPSGIRTVNRLLYS